MRTVELKHPFIRVKDEEQVSFGGNQNWFPQKRLAYYGCGLVSVGDIILYLTRHGKMPLQSIAGKVSGQEIIEQEEYLNYLRKLSQRFFYVSYCIRGITGPMLSVGFNLMSMMNGSPYKATWGVPVSKIHMAVTKMLEKDIPVLFSVGANFPLIWRKKGVKLYQKTATPVFVCCGSTHKHYMTITGIVQDDHNGELLRISSWGKEYYIQWEEYENFIRHDSMALFSNILYISEKH
ncbi:MAG: hypothetical protein PUF12_03010 [Thermoflexaceae bacterium]|nr:hypothetical protein [Thermoflexaceae bacterium]